MNKPKVIHWMLTSKCNLNCGHCFSFDRKDLDLKKNLQIADKIIDLKVEKIVLSGGEPLVKEGIVKIVRYLLNKGQTVRLDTNGLLLPRYLKQLKDINSIGISLDGPTAKIDQRMRNHPNHFKSVICSLDKLKKSKIKIIIHTLVTKYNFDSLQGIANLLEKYPIKSWVIFEYCPYAKAYKNRKKYELKTGEFKKAVKSIKYKGKLNICTVKDRIKAYYFIDSDGSIYTQPKQFGYEYPVFGNIFDDNPLKYLNRINLLNNKKRSELV